MRTQTVGLLCLAILCSLLTAAQANFTYITDRAAGTVTRIRDDGLLQAYSFSFAQPEGIAVGPTGIVYVANQLSGVIDEILPSNGIRPFVTIPLRNATGLSGLAFDSAGNLYAAIQQGDAVAKISPAGTISTYASGVGNPQGLAIDSAGDVFVADNANGRIDKIPAGGGMATLFASVPTATGLAVDPSGNVYAASSALGVIEKLSPAGADLGVYGHVAFPGGIAFDSSGRLLVTSASDPLNSNNAVYAIALDGTVTTYATGFVDPLYVANGVPEPGASELLVVSSNLLGLLIRVRR